MWKTTVIKLVTIILALLPDVGTAQKDIRIRKNFDFDWKFTLGDPVEASLMQFNDTSWEEIRLPHDWSIRLPFKEENGRSMGFMPGGLGWYRKTFEIPAAYRGKKVSVLFDGVYHQSKVYINGTLLGFHAYGYTGFEYDLSPYLNYGGKNILSVRVDHSNSPSSRWYSGSGIYRHVWLMVTHPVSIPTGGTYVTTPRISKESADVRIAATIENNTPNPKNILVLNRIIDPAGKEISSGKSQAVVHPAKPANIEQMLVVPGPAFWSPLSPAMYRMETSVKVNGKVTDVYTTPFGIRSFRFDPDKGFFLNGESVKMKGMCLHMDAGSLGTAVPDRSYERRLEILKEYGCNAIRTSHNPPSPEFLDLCDKMGFLVIDEAFDKWKSGYYGKYFEEGWKKDLNDMLKRDRNHPSIVMWSIGNEVQEQNDTTGHGPAVARMLRKFVNETEPTRPVTVAIAPADVNKRPYNKYGFTEVFDVVGYNYQEPWLLKDKKQFPNRIFFISEAFPYYTGRSNSLRDYKPQNPWYFVAGNDFVFGQFIWAGVDYLGESAGWPSTGWPTCPFDVCMFEKPRGAFHRAVWNQKPMVSIAVADQSLNIDPGKDHWSWPHLASHWNFPQYTGHIIEVQTITNCDSVELLINNASMGRRCTADYTNNTIVWHVPYRPGKIEAKGYNNNREAAKFELNTSGKPSKILLSADKSILSADGQDLSHITVSLADEAGIPVPDADRLITAGVTGNGRFLGIDNGDLRREGSYAGNKLPTYFGKALIIVQSDRKPGPIVVTVSAEGIKESSLTINGKKADL